MDTGHGRQGLRAEGRFVKAPSYMVYIDQGVAPGRAFPPPQKMEQWGRRVIGKSGLGWALSISIFRKGIKARKFVQKGGADGLAKAAPKIRGILVKHLHIAFQRGSGVR